MGSAGELPDATINLERRMIDKTTTIGEAVSRIPDGATVMIGGFGVPGTPFSLIEALLRRGTRDLTLIKNDANEAGMGVDHLLQAGLVRRLITSHLGLNPNAIAMMNDGEIEVEMCPQGILAERIRAGGAGLLGIVTDIGVDTLLAEGKPTLEIDGRRCLIERALRADVALIHADVADTYGNATYAASARNFNPLMAMAADLVVIEAETVVAQGTIAPEAVHTPGPFIDAVVEIPEITEAYGVVVR